MRVALASLLSLALVGAPTAWAADSATTSGSIQQIQTQAQPGDTAILLLPTKDMDSFKQATSDIQQDITIQPASAALSVQGQSYQMITLPARDLQRLDTDLAGTPLHNDAKVVLSFGQFVNVADLSAFDQGQAMAQTESQMPAKDQTGFQSGQSSQQSTVTAPSSTDSQNMSGIQSSAVPFTWRDKVFLLVPDRDLKNLSQIPAPADRQIMVLMPYDRFVQVADLSKIGNESTAVIAPSKEQTAAIAGQPSGAYATTGQPFTGLDRNHVLLVVPADQVKNFSQLSGSTAHDTFVILPLDQFNRAVDVNSLQSSAASTSAVAQAPAAMTEPAKEQTAYTGSAAQPAQPNPTYFLRSTGEANSVLYIFPTAGGTILSLRDGTDLLVPKSVNIPSTVQQGAWVQGTFERVDGQNLMTSLDVIPNSTEHSNAGGDAS